MKYAVVEDGCNSGGRASRKTITVQAKISVSKVAWVAVLITQYLTMFLLVIRVKVSEKALGELTVDELLKCTLSKPGTAMSWNSCGFMQLVCDKKPYDKTLHQSCCISVTQKNSYLHLWWPKTILTVSKFCTKVMRILCTVRNMTKGSRNRSMIAAE